MRRQGARLIAAALLTVGVAGCIGGEDAVEPTDALPDVGEGVSPPAWKVGDWWTYHFTSDVYGEDFSATFVVGEAGPEGYVVGMPADAYELGPILYHMPPLGRLLPTLAYNVHDVPFEPFRFPLVDLATWDTAWATTPIKFVAHGLTKETDAGGVPAFHVTNAGSEATSNGRRFDLVYDASVGWFTEYQRRLPDDRTLERIVLTDNGRGYEGAVRLLDGITIVLLEARSGGVLRGAAPAPPVATFSPGPEVDTLLVACVFGGGPGAYEVEIRSSSGAKCEFGGTVDPGDLVVRHKVAEVPAEAGGWQARIAAGGSGFAAAEVLGYRAYEVDLG